MACRKCGKKGRVRRRSVGVPRAGKRKAKRAAERR
jgi:hypothetical protein